MNEDKMAVHIYEQHKLIMKLGLILWNTGNYDCIPEEAKIHPAFESVDDYNNEQLSETTGEGGPKKDQDDF